MASTTFYSGETVIQASWLQYVNDFVYGISASLPATSITFTPTGGISSTTVAAALAELDTEKAPKASPVFTGTVTIPAITGMTTPLSVAQGGTSLATWTANNVLLGNGTSAPSFVAPGTSGNVLTSNGTTWTSAAASSTGTDTKAKVSSNDTTAGYLNGKLVAGTHITFTENNNGSNETLTISAAAGMAADNGSLQIGSFVLGAYTPLTTLSNGATASGANILPVIFQVGGDSNYGSVLSGVWRNVSGVNIPVRVFSDPYWNVLFQRIS